MSICWRNQKVNIFMKKGKRRSQFQGQGHKGQKNLRVWKGLVNIYMHTKYQSSTSKDLEEMGIFGGNQKVNIFMKKGERRSQFQGQGH